MQSFYMLEVMQLIKYICFHTKMRYTVNESKRDKRSIT
jgi:hypothetical protein